jgi:predicted nucleotidyltransferase
MSKTKAVEIDKLLAKVRQDMEVLAAMIYGSAARDEKAPFSDIDICLVMTSQPKPFKLTSLSHKRLEYMKDISLVRDEDQLYELAFRTAQAFEDFKHIYYGYLKEVELAG